MIWADQRTLAALRSPTSPTTQVLDIFSHLLASEHIWISRIDQREPKQAVWPSLSLDEAERLMNENHESYRTLLSTLSEERLHNVVTYTNTQSKRFETVLHDILIHVTHHGMYHRGQIALLVRSAGGIPNSTDFIVYARQ